LVAETVKSTFPEPSELTVALITILEGAGFFGVSAFLQEAKTFKEIMAAKFTNKYFII
jgi:hypothetical protein